MKTVYFTCFIILAFAASAFAQQEILQTDTSANGTITFRRYNTTVNPKHISETNELLKITLGLRPNDSLRLDAVIQQEKLGLRHILYQQYYKGVKVLYGTYAIHAKNGIIETINGHFIKVGNPSVKPQLDEQSALSKALNEINAKVYGWQDPGTENMFKKNSQDSSATLYPKGELVIFYDDSVTHSYRLAYMFHIYSVKPLRDNNVFVDAISGKIIGIENLIRDGNATGTADTKYSGTQTITTDSYSGGYRLREVRNGVNIQTYNMQRGSNYNNAVDFSDNDNNWAAAEYHNTNQDDAALDVHWGMEKVYDYWNTIRHRNSWDGSGTTLIGYVHANLIGMGYPNDDNAFWDPTLHRMTYGDGQTQFNAVTSLDVIAHETGHGFTEGVIGANDSSILSCQGVTCPETSALNEGISDIWGAVVENWAAPNKQTWEIGEDIMKDGYPCLRSLSDPNTGGDPTGVPTGGYPDTYKGTDWYTGTNESTFAHVNSTVLSHWFYLLSEGGTGTNNIGHLYNVAGIGITEAANIVWQAEIGLYLQPHSNYTNAREAMISAASNLYGSCSNEAVQVEEAWYAVGVGDAPPFIYIVGDSAFCSSATYSLSETDGGTVTWSASPSGIVSLTPSGSSIIATKITKGNATLTATLTRTCGNLTFTRDISTDPQVTSIAATDQGCYNGYESWALTANPNMSNVTNWQWKVDNPNPNYPIYIESPNSQSTNVEVQGGGGISVTYQDACGETSERNGITVYSGSCSYSSVTISPNPATNTITITNQPYNQNNFLKTIPTAEKNATLGLAYIKEVKVYDMNGRLREEKAFSGKMNQVQIDVSNLTPGIYILKISDDKFTEQQKTVIQ